MRLLTATAHGAVAQLESHRLTEFQSFGLAEPIVRALAEENHLVPTPIQTQTVPLALAGRDIIGIAQTGTGKTAAFALPILHQLSGKPAPTERKSCRVLVLSPTRELSSQILDSFRAYGRHLRVASALAIGGVPMGKQVRSLMGGVDVLVATPGRLLDLVEGNALRLNRVSCLVLDEADRMLDMGFIHDIRRIIAKLPKERQTLLFSATMPEAIARLAAEMLRNPARVAVAPASATADRVTQRIVHVDRQDRSAVLFSRAPSTAPTSWCVGSPRPASAPRPFTATNPRASASACCRRSARGRCASSSPPTSRRAASTSRACRTW
jgi:superfamily II DNA/RNA helicase